MTIFGRIFRQLFFGVIFLSLVAGSSYYFYQVSFPIAESCNDNIKNQDEAGVDCGGICDIVCPPPPPPEDTKPIEVVWARVFYSDVGVYDLAAKVNNSNLRWGVAEFQYNFIARDASDAVVIEQRGTSYLLPGSYDYLIIPSVKSDKNPVKAELDIIKEGQKWSSDNLSISFPFREKIYTAKNENNIPVASAKLTNATTYDFDKIDIKVVLFGENGEPVAANVSNLTTIRSGEERLIRMPWSNSLQSEVFSHDFKATTNIYDPRNFMTRFGEEEENYEYR